MDHTINSIFWLFIMFMALLPWLKQQMLESARLNLIHKIEKKRKSRVITLIHRQETMSILGFPLFRYIDINDSEDILRAFRLTPEDMPIDLILHTPGGLVLAAEQIAKAIKNHKAPVRVFVPHYAMSGGTLISLAADEIYMDPNAVLGPVDPQLGDMPAASLVKIPEMKPYEKIEDKTLVLIDMSKKAIKQVYDFVYWLLEDKMDKEKASEVARLLSEGYFTHDFPITFERAKELGLNVKPEVPKEIYQLMALFPQPVRHMPSVEYIPAPYKKSNNK